MKKHSLLLGCIVLTSSCLGGSKVSVPEKNSISSTIKKAVFKTRKAIANISELTIGSAVLGYLIKMLPGKSSDGLNKYGTIYKIMEGDKFWIGVYITASVISISLITNGLEGLQEEYDIKGISLNTVKKIYSALARKKKKGKKNKSLL